MAASDAELRARDQHPRPVDISGHNAIADCDIRVPSAPRLRIVVNPASKVILRFDPGDCRTMGGNAERCISVNRGIEGDVIVDIDQAGQASAGAQVEDARSGGAPPTPVIVSSLMTTLALMRYFPAITSSSRAHRTTVIVGPSAATAMPANNRANRRTRISISLLHNSSFDAARLLSPSAKRGANPPCFRFGYRRDL
jgi:hypothetical protein